MVPMTGGQVEERQQRLGVHHVRMTDRAPATPPGMRVRTGRFEELRSRESGNAQLVGPPEGQDRGEKLAATRTSGGVAATVARLGLGSQRQQRPVDGLAAFPLLELDGPHPMSRPLVQVAPDSLGVCAVGSRPSNPELRTAGGRLLPTCSVRRTGGSAAGRVA